jgi:hypothetical protein
LIHRGKTILLVVLVATGLVGGAYLGARVYYSSTSQSCANLGYELNPNAPCSHQAIEDIVIMNSYNSSLGGFIHFLVYNPGSSPVTLADIFIDNSGVNYTLSPSSGAGSGCSETLSVIGPSAHCIVIALVPNPSSTSHSIVIFTALGSKFSQNVTLSS